MTKNGFNMTDYENNIIAVNNDATSKTLPSLIADLGIRNDWAWSQDHFADTAMKIIHNFSAQEVCELGGGRAPFLSRDFVNDTGVRYVVNDVSAAELERAPGWIERGLFDIAAPEVPPPVPLSFRLYIFEDVTRACARWQGSARKCFQHAKARWNILPFSSGAIFSCNFV